MPEVDDEHRLAVVQFGPQLARGDPRDPQLPEEPLPPHNLDRQVHGERPD
jgi:hypothetical protein